MNLKGSEMFKQIQGCTTFDLKKTDNIIILEDEQGYDVLYEIEEMRLISKKRQLNYYSMTVKFSDFAQYHYTQLLKNKNL